MKDVELKNEALRMATLIMCQSATAGKGEKIPTPEDVLDVAKKFYAWYDEKGADNVQKS